MNFAVENTSLTSATLENVTLRMTALNLSCAVFVLGMVITVYRRYAYEVMEYEVLPLGERAVKYDPHSSPARLKPKHSSRSVSVFEELDEDSC
jgi:hypothetical protein